MLNRRYLYNNSAIADKLHYLYRGTYSEDINHRLIEGELKDLYKNILSFFPNRTELQEDHIRRAIPKWVRVFDPNMLYCSLPADDTHGRNSTYLEIQTKCQLPKKLLDLIHSLTFSGRMQATIEYAKQNPNLQHPTDPYSSYRDKFADPISEWYHDKFAKDLFGICHPNWKRKELSSVEEKKTLLDLWFHKNKKLKRTPNITDTWAIPVGHRLEPYHKFGFKILPTPGTVWKELGTIERDIFYLDYFIKQGKKPPQFGMFKYHNPNEAAELEKKYPDILCPGKQYEIKLTPIQQRKIDKWIELEKLVSTDESDIELIKRLSTKERQFVGNYLKQLDQKFAFQRPKYVDALAPIINRLKEKRPMLYEIYCKKKKKFTSENFYDITGAGSKNEEKQKNILILAKSGAEYPHGDRSITCAIGKFTGKNNRYPEFAKTLKKLRPDWFDKKLRYKETRKKFWSKKKAINE